MRKFLILVGIISLLQAAPHSSVQIHGWQIADTTIDSTKVSKLSCDNLPENCPFYGTNDSDFFWYIDKFVVPNNFATIFNGDTNSIQNCHLIERTTGGFLNIYGVTGIDTMRQLISNLIFIDDADACSSCVLDTVQSCWIHSSGMSITNCQNAFIWGSQGLVDNANHSFLIGLKQDTIQNVSNLYYNGYERSFFEGTIYVDTIKSFSDTSVILLPVSGSSGTYKIKSDDNPWIFDSLFLIGGSNITLTQSNDSITINADIKGYKVKANDNPWILDSLFLIEGNNITLTQNNDSIYITSSDSVEWAGHVEWDSINNIPEEFSDGIDDVGFIQLRAEDNLWLTDSVTFVAGDNISIVQDGDSITISANTDSNDIWIREDTIIRVKDYENEQVLIGIPDTTFDIPDVQLFVHDSDKVIASIKSDSGSVYLFFQSQGKGTYFLQDSSLRIFPNSSGNTISFEHWGLMNLGASHIQLYGAREKEGLLNFPDDYFAHKLLFMGDTTGFYNTLYSKRHWYWQIDSLSYGFYIHSDTNATDNGRVFAWVDSFDIYPICMLFNGATQQHHNIWGISILEDSTWLPVISANAYKNVGIRTACPSYSLDVNGDCHIKEGLLLSDGVFINKFYKESTEDTLFLVSESDTYKILKNYNDSNGSSGSYKVKSNDNPWILDSLFLIGGNNIDLTQSNDSIYINAHDSVIYAQHTDWDSINNMPSGFSDGVDDVGFLQLRADDNPWLTDSVTLVAGTNIALIQEGDSITINANTSKYRVKADNNSWIFDSLFLIGGNNIILTESNDSIYINAFDSVTYAQHVEWDSINNIPSDFADEVDDVGFSQLRAEDNPWLLDSVTFVAGDNVSIVQNGDSIVISASGSGTGSGQWLRNEDCIYTLHTTDNVSIGDDTAEARLQIENNVSSKKSFIVKSPTVSYKRYIVISNQIDSTLTDYQVKIVLHRGNFNFSHCKDDLSDIYFKAADTSSNLLYFYREYVGNDSAVIWVRIPEIEASGSDTIVMFYGNPDDIYESTPESTFDFWDDFEGGILDTSKWEEIQTGWSVVTEGGNYVLQSPSPSSGVEYHIKLKHSKSNFFLHFKWKETYQLSYRARLITKTNVASDQKYKYFMTARTGSFDTNYLKKTVNGSSSLLDSNGDILDSGVWYKITVYKTSDSIKYKYEKEDEEKNSYDLKGAADVAIGENPFLLDMYEARGIFDDVFIAKLVYPEPTITVDTEIIVSGDKQISFIIDKYPYRVGINNGNPQEMLSIYTQDNSDFLGFYTDKGIQLFKITDDINLFTKDTLSFINIDNINDTLCSFDFTNSNLRVSGGLYTDSIAVNNASFINKVWKSGTGDTLFIKCENDTFNVLKSYNNSSSYKVKADDNSWILDSLFLISGKNINLSQSNDSIYINSSDSVKWASHVEWDSINNIPSGFFDGTDNIGFAQLRAENNPWLTDSVTFVAGDNISLTQEGDSIIISSLNSGTGECLWTREDTFIRIVDYNDEHVTIGNFSSEQSSCTKFCVGDTHNVEVEIVSDEGIAALHFHNNLGSFLIEETEQCMHVYSDLGRDSLLISNFTNASIGIPTIGFHSDSLWLEGKGCVEEGLKLSDGVFINKFYKDSSSDTLFVISENDTYEILKDYNICSDSFEGYWAYDSACSTIYPIKDPDHPIDHVGIGTDRCYTTFGVHGDMTVGMDTVCRIYSVRVLITNNEDTTLKNYQIKLVLSSDLLKNACMECNGICFYITELLHCETESDPFYYKLFESPQHDSVVLWVRVPVLRPDTTETLLVEWGQLYDWSMVYNLDPITGFSFEDPESTFEFWDDFEEMTIDTTKWRIIAGEWSVEGGIDGYGLVGRKESESGFAKIAPKISGENLRLYCEVYQFSPNSSVGLYLNAKANDSSSFYEFYKAELNTGTVKSYLKKKVNGGAEQVIDSTEENLENNKWYKVEFKKKEDSLFCKYEKWNEENSGWNLRGQTDANVDEDSIYLALLDGDSVCFNRIFITKMVEKEPTISILPVDSSSNQYVGKGHLTVTKSGNVLIDNARRLGLSLDVLGGIKGDSISVGSNLFISKITRVGDSLFVICGPDTFYLLKK